MRPELVTVEHLDAVSRKVYVRDVAASVRAPAIRQHTSAHVSTRQHTSTYEPHASAMLKVPTSGHMKQVRYKRQ
jgi:uncharacterized protein YcnI